MERRLLEAAQKGNVDELNDLITSNGLVLEEMAIKEDSHTPLHVACVAGHLAFVRALLKLKPEFAEMLNADGFSPLHIASARGHVEIVSELLKTGQHLCSVEGRERRIPLHYAAANGKLHVMGVLLFAWPESIEKTTARGETALHLAVKNNRFGAVAMLVERLKEYEKEQVINWPDNNGNTVLHLAAAGKNFEVVDYMLHGRAPVVEVNALNKSDSTPLDVSGDREIREILARSGAMHGRGRSNSPASRPDLVDDNHIEGANRRQSDEEPAAPPLSHPQLKNSTTEKETLGEIRNDLLVVATLIASATYQSVIQPPSLIKFDHGKDNSTNSVNHTATGSGNNEVSSRTYATGLVYTLFVGGNTFGFLMSVQMIICLTKKLPVWLPLMLSLIAMVVTYFAFTLSAMISSGGDVKAEMLRLTPFIISVFLVMMQKWLATALKFFWEPLSKLHLVGDMYTLRSPDTKLGDHSRGEDRRATNTMIP